MSLSAIGLILNIAGTLLVIVFGLPSKIIDEHGPSLVAEYNDEDSQKFAEKISKPNCWVILEFR